jgi:hypothetical protein
MEFNGTFDQRINDNFAEVIFINFCKNNGWKYKKMGFDNEEHIKNIWNFNKTLQKLPDFVIEKNDKNYVVEVKGYKRFKKDDFDMIDKLINAYDSAKAPLIYAFCWNKKVIFKKPQQVKELYQEGIEDKYHDGKVFRLLNI